MWAATVRHRLATVLGRSRGLVWFQQERTVVAAGSRCKSKDDEDARERGGAAQVAARGWQISAENESDWRSHAAAVARSVDLIKARLQWKKVLFRLQELDAELEKPNLWDDASRAGQFSRERGALAGQVKSVVSMEEELLEHVGLAELAYEENDTQVAADATRGLAELRKIASEKELVALLSDEHDSRSCFIEVQAGAGGTESMDWASMVMRMYKMWAQNRDYEVTVVDEMPGEEAGIKRATIRVDGLYAYGYAKTEAGVHRLVRISPFDAGKRRHTSFAAVAVIPALDESEVSIEIDEADLRIERFRAGGAGGQHVNKTESAVRIIHLPTGIVVQCQADRSQHRNKATALNMLHSRLYQMEVTRRATASAQHTQSLSDVSWGSQIRSYVLQVALVRLFTLDWSVMANPGIGAGAAGAVQPVVPTDAPSDSVLSAEFPRLHLPLTFTRGEVDALGGLHLFDHADDGQPGADHHVQPQAGNPGAFLVIASAVTYLQGLARSWINTICSFSCCNEL